MRLKKRLRRKIMKFAKSGRRFYRLARRTKRLNKARPQRGGFHL